VNLRSPAIANRGFAVSQTGRRKSCVVATRRKAHGEKEKGVKKGEAKDLVAGQAQEALRKPGRSRVRLLLVSLPRGAMAAVWIDPVSGVIASNHPGLQTILRRGIRDLDGRVLFPSDGKSFLSALYDHLFLGS
jgi:hypothetical protein